jgi:MFS transporter, DHA2 family, glioxin efflux transporter
MLVLLFFYRTPSHIKPVNMGTKQLLLTMDFPGIIVILGSLVCLTLALEWGGITKHWNSSEVISTLAGFISLFILWCGVEWMQQERALVVPRILKQRTIAVCAAFIFW